MNKWLRRIRNSLGYGVQSPSDFYFVQHVLREQSPYYSYTDLEEMSKKYSSRLPSYPDETNKLLFRLANYIQPDTILEVGAGLSTFAMAKACPSARCIAITPSDACSEAMRPLLSEYPEVEVKNGDEMALFYDSVHQTGKIDILHIAHTEHYQEIVASALPYATDHALLIIEDIHANKEKHDWWEKLQENHPSGISYDLTHIGLLFFDRSRHKETYWINLKD